MISSFNYTQIFINLLLLQILYCFQIEYPDLACDDTPIDTLFTYYNSVKEKRTFVSSGGIYWDLGENEAPTFANSRVVKQMVPVGSLTLKRIDMVTWYDRLAEVLFYRFHEKSYDYCKPRPGGEKLFICIQVLKHY